MDLSSYLSLPLINRSDFARRVGVSPSVVYQWGTGRRPIPVERCAAIELATDGAVTRRDLRPEDWHLIWPELVAAPAGGGPTVEAEHA